MSRTTSLVHGRIRKPGERPGPSEMQRKVKSRTDTRHPAAKAQLLERTHTMNEQHNKPAPDLAKAAAQKIAARFTRAFIKKGAMKSA